jgi:hypothetical protein
MMPRVASQAPPRIRPSAAAMPVDPICSAATPPCGKVLILCDADEGREVRFPDADTHAPGSSPEESQARGSQINFLAAHCDGVTAQDHSKRRILFVLLVQVPVHSHQADRFASEILIVQPHIL